MSDLTTASVIVSNGRRTVTVNRSAVGFLVLNGSYLITYDFTLNGVSLLSSGSTTHVRTLAQREIEQTAYTPLTPSPWPPDEGSVIMKNIFATRYQGNISGNVPRGQLSS
jgi:hypothetical protein